MFDEGYTSAKHEVVVVMVMMDVVVVEFDKGPNNISSDFSMSVHRQQVLYRLIQ